jgi:peroxiredoxin
MLKKLLRRFHGCCTEMLQAGADAPEIELPDSAGRPVTLSELVSKGPVVAAFYKVSCPVCQFTLPFLERIHKAYGNEKVAIVGICQDDAGDTREFGAEYGLSFPSLIDASGYPASNAYGLTNVPSVFLIAPDGKIAVSFSGFDKQGLEDIGATFAKHLSKPAVPVFQPCEHVPDHKPG